MPALLNELRINKLYEEIALSHSIEDLFDYKQIILDALEKQKCTLSPHCRLNELRELLKEASEKGTQGLREKIVQWAEAFANGNLTAVDFRGEHAPKQVSLGLSDEFEEDIYTSLASNTPSRGFFAAGSARDIEKILGSLLKSPDKVSEKKEIITPIYIEEVIPTNGKTALFSHLETVAFTRPRLETTVLIPLNDNDNKWDLAIIELDNKARIKSAKLWSPNAYYEHTVEKKEAYRYLKSAIDLFNANKKTCKIEAFAGQYHSQNGSMDLVVREAMKQKFGSIASQFSFFSSSVRKLSPELRDVLHSELPSEIRDAIISLMRKRNHELKSPHLHLAAKP